MFPDQKPTIQRDPSIKFLCITEWFCTNLIPSYTTFIPVGKLYQNYMNWVNNSINWNAESLLTLSVFSKHLSVLLHANNWKYSRAKLNGARGYYGIRLSDLVNEKENSEELMKG